MIIFYNRRLEGLFRNHNYFDLILCLLHHVRCKPRLSRLLRSIFVNRTHPSARHKSHFLISDYSRMAILALFLESPDHLDNIEPRQRTRVSEKLAARKRHFACGDDQKDLVLGGSIFFLLLDVRSNFFSFSESKMSNGYPDFTAPTSSNTLAAALSQQLSTHTQNQV